MNDDITDAVAKARDFAKMDSGSLTARLKSLASNEYYDTPEGRIMDASANRIEDLEAKLAAVTRERDEGRLIIESVRSVSDSPRREGEHFSDADARRLEEIERLLLERPGTLADTGRSRPHFGAGEDR